MRLLCVIALVALTGCGGGELGAKNRIVMDDMMASKKAYKDCLAQKSNCASEKASYEADLSAFNAMTDRTSLVIGRSDKH